MPIMPSRNQLLIIASVNQNLGPKFPPNKINNGEPQQSLLPRPMPRVIHSTPAQNNYHATPCAASRRFSSIGIANHRSHCNSLRRFTCTFSAHPCLSVQLILANFENSPPLPREL